LQHKASPVSRVLCVVVFLAACNGVLREKPVESEPAPALGVQAPACDDPIAPTSDGHHRPGEDCLMCHYQGGGGPPFSFGGTLYTDIAGTTPVAGAAIHVIDTMGTDAVVITAANGNFWSYDLLTFPAVAFASLCPDVTPMATPIGETDGSCNKSGCHTSGFGITVP